MGAPHARLAALLAAATFAVGAWLLWPRSEPRQWPTVSDAQVAHAVRAAAARRARAAHITCRPVAYAWRCLVRYRDDSTATCNVGLRHRPLVGRPPDLTVIC